MRRNHQLACLVVIFSVIVGCGDKGLSSQQKNYNEYLDVMQGGGGIIRSGSLRDLGNDLLATFNENLTSWQNNEITDSAFDERLRVWVLDNESFQDDLHAVDVSGELRSIHNLYINSFARYESAARTFRLFLSSADISLLTAYGDQIDEADALLADYVARLQEYMSKID